MALDFENPGKPVTFKYRNGKNTTATIKAVSVTGEIPAYSNTYYHVFKTASGDYFKVAESRLLPGYKEKSSWLFGRPYRTEVEKLSEVRLERWPQYWRDLDGLPDDTEDVWRIEGISHAWVIQCSDKAILHLMNNPEKTVKGKFEVAAKKLFPKQKVLLLLKKVTIIEKEL